MLITDEQIKNTDLFHETYAKLCVEWLDSTYDERIEESYRVVRATLTPLDILIEAHKNK
jgi:hypothetical protein